MEVLSSFPPFRTMHRNDRTLPPLLRRRDEEESSLYPFPFLFSVSEEREIRKPFFFPPPLFPSGSRRRGEGLPLPPPSEREIRFSPLFQVGEWNKRAFLPPLRELEGRVGLFLPLRKKLQHNRPSPLFFFDPSHAEESEAISILSSSLPSSLPRRNGASRRFLSGSITKSKKPSPPSSFLAFNRKRNWSLPLPTCPPVAAVRMVQPLFPPRPGAEGLSPPSPNFCLLIKRGEGLAFLLPPSSSAE